MADPATFEPDPDGSIKAATDEPTFTLRAQDVLAPAVIRAWCEMAAMVGVPPEKIREARQAALRMEQWGHRRVPD